jgi:hypothetical protein
MGHPQRVLRVSKRIVGVHARAGIDVDQDTVKGHGAYLGTFSQITLL